MNGLHVVDSVRRLNVTGDGIIGLDENMHTFTENGKVRVILVFDIVVSKGASILQLVPPDEGIPDET